MDPLRPISTCQSATTPPTTAHILPGRHTMDGQEPRTHRRDRRLRRYWSREHGRLRAESQSEQEEAG
jgi:hypothetical protein